jgi:hypothetical protein
MWGLYMIGLIAYIPQSPVQSYLSLTLKRLGFTTFDANMLSIPSAALQIILMLILCKSSEIFKERTFHCLFGELWSLPLLAALIALPNGGYNWPRFTISTLISGYPYFHPIVSAWISENTFDVKKRALTAATYNVIVQIGSVISSREFLTFVTAFNLPEPLLIYHRNLPQWRLSVLSYRKQSPHLTMRFSTSRLHPPAGVPALSEPPKREEVEFYVAGGARELPSRSSCQGKGGQPAARLPLFVLGGLTLSLD